MNRLTSIQSIKQSIDIFRERVGEEDDFLQQNEKAHSNPGHPSILSAHLLPFQNLRHLKFRSHWMRTIHLHLQIEKLFVDVESSNRVLSGMHVTF